jgi:hypothetical protein
MSAGIFRLQAQSEAFTSLMSVLNDMSEDEKTILNTMNAARLSQLPVHLYPNSILNNVAEQQMNWIIGQGAALTEVHTRPDGSGGLTDIDDWLTSTGYPGYSPLAPNTTGYAPDVIAIRSDPVRGGLTPDNLVEYWAQEANRDRIISYRMSQNNLLAQPFYNSLYREVGIAYAQNLTTGDRYFVFVFASQPNLLPVVAAQAGVDSSELSIIRTDVVHPEITLFLSNENAYPSGTVDENGGSSIGRAEYINISERVLDLPCPASGIVLSGGWKSFASQVVYTVSEGDGAKTIHVYFCDSVGRQSETRVDVKLESPNTPITDDPIPVPFTEVPAPDTLLITLTPTSAETATFTATSPSTPSEPFTLTPTETPTDTATPTETPTFIPTETATPLPTATWTHTPTPTATPTEMPTASATPTSTATVTEMPSATATPTPTEPPSATPTPTDDLPVPAQQRLIVQWTDSYLVIYNPGLYPVNVDSLVISGSATLTPADWDRMAGFNVTSLEYEACILVMTGGEQPDLDTVNLETTLGCHGFYAMMGVGPDEALWMAGGRPDFAVNINGTQSVCQPSQSTFCLVQFPATASQVPIAQGANVTVQWSGTNLTIANATTVSVNVSGLFLYNATGTNRITDIPSVAMQNLAAGACIALTSSFDPVTNGCASSQTIDPTTMVWTQASEFVVNVRGFETVCVSASGTCNVSVPAP